MPPPGWPRYARNDGIPNGRPREVRQAIVDPVDVRVRTQRGWCGRPSILVHFRAVGGETLISIFGACLAVMLLSWYQRLVPADRTLDDETACSSDLIRKQVVAKFVLAYSQMTVCGPLQLARVPHWRKGDDDTFLRKRIPNHSDRCGEIAVTGDQECSIETVLERVHEQVRGNVDVGHLLFVTLPCSATRSAGLLFGKVVAIIDVDVRSGSQRVEPKCLAARVLTASAVADTGREVATGSKSLIAFEQRPRQSRQIEPVIFTPAFLLQTEVEIEAINVADDTPHAVRAPTGGS